jgi:hypothetical protein
VVAQSKMSITKFKKKKATNFGVPHNWLIYESHYLWSHPRNSGLETLKEHEILEQNKILSIYLMQLQPMVKVMGPTVATWSLHMQLIFHVPITTTTTSKEPKIWRNPVCEKHSTQHHHVLVAIGYSYSRVSLCFVCVYVCPVCVSVCKCFQLFGIRSVFTSEFFF